MIPVHQLTKTLDVCQKYKNCWSCLHKQLGVTQKKQEEHDEYNQNFVLNVSNFAR